MSGSMSKEQIDRAFAFVQKGIEAEDFIIAFDVNAAVVDSNKLPYLGPVGRGGTDATEALALAKSLGCYSVILIGDGMMLPEQLAQFDKFIDIESIK